MDNKLTKLYSQILESADCTIDKDGTVIAPYSEEPVQVRIGSTMKTLIIPTRNNQKNADPKTTVFFDPASESVVKGNSEVLNRLIELFTIRLTMAADLTTYTILSLALDKEAYDKARVATRKLIDGLPPISKTTISDYGKVQRKARNAKRPTPTITLNVVRGRLIDGTKYARVCKMDIPLLNSPEGKFGDVKMSKNSDTAMRHIYSLLAPDTTAVGSNSKTMPGLDTLVEMYKTCAEHLNLIHDQLGKNKGETKRIDLSWVDAYKDLPALSKQFLPMPSEGNIGVDLKSTAKTAAPEVPKPKPMGMSKTPVQRATTTSTSVPGTRQKQPLEFGQEDPDNYAAGAHNNAPLHNDEPLPKGGWAVRKDVSANQMPAGGYGGYNPPPQQHSRMGFGGHGGGWQPQQRRPMSRQAVVMQNNSFSYTQPAQNSHYHY